LEGWYQPGASELMVWWSCAPPRQTTFRLS